MFWYVFIVYSIIITLLYYSYFLSSLLEHEEELLGCKLHSWCHWSLSNENPDSVQTLGSFYALKQVAAFISRFSQSKLLLFFQRFYFKMQSACLQTERSYLPIMLIISYKNLWNLTLLGTFENFLHCLDRHYPLPIYVSYIFAF